MYLSVCLECNQFLSAQNVLPYPSQLWDWRPSSSGSNSHHFYSASLQKHPKDSVHEDTKQLQCSMEQFSHFSILMLPLQLSHYPPQNSRPTYTNSPLFHKPSKAPSLVGDNIALKVCFPERTSSETQLWGSWWRLCFHLPEKPSKHCSPARALISFWAGTSQSLWSGLSPNTSSFHVQLHQRWTCLGMTSSKEMGHFTLLVHHRGLAVRTASDESA